MKTRPMTGWGLQGTAYISENSLLDQEGHCFLREQERTRAAQPVIGRQHLFQIISMSAPPISICTMGSQLCC